MKCNDFDKSKSRHHSHTNLDNLDKALHDLGMLSAITEARHDFMREPKSNYSVMRVNTRYVGYWMKRSNKNRLCPYVLPVRHRTKSENSEAIAGEASDNCEFKSSLFEPSTSSSSRDDLETKSPAKRCQSLENLNLSSDTPASLETSPEMDCVSTRIQKLQVDE